MGYDLAYYPNTTLSSELLKPMCRDIRLKYFISIIYFEEFQQLYFTYDFVIDVK